MTVPFRTSGLQIVQRSVAPTIGLCTERLLYYRNNDFASLDHRRQQWRLGRGGQLWFDTYFNGLSVRRWKETAPLNDLYVDIAFDGRLTVRLYLMQVGGIATMLDETEIASDTPTVHRLRVREWDALDDGILFLSMHATDDSIVRGFSFATSTPPVRAVRLGLCITHFDRKPQIVPAIERLKRQLLDDPAFSDRVCLVVVDNSRSLTADETVGATLLPNPNLGGAGGFARGLMHLQDDGSFTHALFMDDDASCEVESIRRTVSLLAHAADPRTAVSGAMLRKPEPYRQFERGARFRGLCRPLRSEVDLRDPAVLAWNEREMTADYGGWWFFGFPLDARDGYPYPFFVRGDDVDFALRNDFRIVHANGVASWQDDFSYKHGPQVNYLDTRSHLLHILHGFVGGRMLALFVALRLFLLANLAGQYEVAAAAVMALEDVGRGPDFFREHADLAEPRRRIQAFNRAERMKAMDPGVMRDAVFTNLRETRLRNAWRWITANGHFIPRVFFHRRPARFDKGFALPLRGTFCRRQVFVHHEVTGTGMTLEHSKRRFFANLWRFACAAGGFGFRFSRLSRAYRAAYPDLTSDAFWRTQFGLASSATSDVAGARSDHGAELPSTAPSALPRAA